MAGANLMRRAPPFGLRRIQAIVVPGKAADPAKIIEMLATDPMFQGRQFGIIDSGQHSCE